MLTERLHLVYDRGPFSTSGLSVQVRGGVSTWHSVWRYGESPSDARRRRRQPRRHRPHPGHGRRPAAAGAGRAVPQRLRGDRRLAHPAARRRRLGQPAHRATPSDLYVFGYGRDYPAALRALYALSGPQPLLPRWALGNWWSRYHRYSADEYLALLDRFAAEGIPFSVAVLDMDWHLVDVDPRYGSGWTGYTWNRELFPDPPAFLRRAARARPDGHPQRPPGRRRPGLRGRLPGDGRGARASTRPPSARSPSTSPIREFLAAYFDVLHRQLEEQGVDFWWLDWQQGPHTRVAGIDPLWMLNHFHFLDSARDGRRPLTFSRYAGPGSHRYPVGFSGDTIITWASLDFQPEFTATAANIGYGWWSHDIGGHMGGIKDDELATRWVQLGVFSPIIRLHSVLSPFTSKEPWQFGRAARAGDDRGAAAAAPAAALPAHDEPPGRAFRACRWCRRCTTPTREAEEAYRARNQYAFGSELIVAPITTPADRRLLLGSVTGWLPPGTWVDVFTELVYDGGREMRLHRGPDGIPVLAPAGAIVPLDAAEVPGNTAAENPAALEVLVVVGADGAFDLVEDDGVGPGDEPARWVSTPIRFSQADGVLQVGPAEGNTGCLPARRDWTLTFLACQAAGEPAVTVDGAPVAAEVLRTGRRTSVRVADVPVTAAVRVELGERPRLAANDVADRLFALVHRAQLSYEVKTRLYAAATADAPLAIRLSQLQALRLGPELEAAVFELLLARPEPD